MPRKINYEEKIAELDKQIATKEEQLKKLKAKRGELATTYNKIKNAVLIKYMEDNNLAADDVVNALKESKPTTSKKK